MTRVINISDFKDLIKPEIIDCLLLLKAKGYLNRLIICGSLGLVLNKELKREVKDIDLLTIDDLYGCDNSLQVYGDYSEGNTPQWKYKTVTELVEAIWQTFLDEEGDIWFSSLRKETSIWIENYKIN